MSCRNGARSRTAGAMFRCMGTIDDLLVMIRQLTVSERLRLIEQATRDIAQDTPKQPSVGEAMAQSLSVDEFLAARLAPHLGIGPVTLQDTERAVADGMSRRGSL